jgi:hypothetical protein
MAKKPKISLGDPITQLRGQPDVVDFQATRCSLHIQKLQRSLRDLAVGLAEEAECPLCGLSELETVDEESLAYETYAVFDFLDLRTGRRKSLLTAKWAPFVLFVGGEQVLSLRATYDTRGARVSGVSLLIDGSSTTSRCKSLSVAEKICLSYIRTYVRANEQEV